MPFSLSHLVHHPSVHFSTAERSRSSTDTECEWLRVSLKDRTSLLPLFFRNVFSVVFSWTATCSVDFRGTRQTSLFEEGEVRDDQEDYRVSSKVSRRDIS